MAGEIRVSENQGQLVVERSLRDGCQGIFLCIWVIPWTYGVTIVGASVLAAPTLVGILLLLALASFDVLMMSVIVCSWTGRERLCVDTEVVTWEMRAILRFRHRVIPLRNIESVDLLPLNPTPNDKQWAVGVLTVTGDGREIRFGRGLDGAQLHALLPHVRAQIDRYRPTPLNSPVGAAQIAPIDRAAWKETWHQAHPPTTSEKAEGWLAVPAFILVGCLMVWGGIHSMRTGGVSGILFGVVLTGIGLVFSVGLTCASVAVFRDWLRGRK